MRRAGASPLTRGSLLSAACAILASTLPAAQLGGALREQKISATAGGFGGPPSSVDLFGSALAPMGDRNGDGIPDVAVLVPGDDDGGLNLGAVWLLDLAANGTVLAEHKISQTSGGFGGVIGAGDQLGEGLAAPGDLDGDGVRDLVVGESRDDDGASIQGAVWVLLLNADGTVKVTQKISGTSGGFTGALDIGDRFGGSVSGLGDLDGDGVNDIAVGATGDDDGGAGRGAVWILFLNADGTAKAHQKISQTSGGFGDTLDNLDAFGTAVACLGDLNGDGFPELAVSARRDDDDRGSVWILFLGPGGTVLNQTRIGNGAGGLSGTLDPDDHFGMGLTALDDLDEDGVPDLAVGADGDDDGGTGQGAVWILFLRADGTVKFERKLAEGQGGVGTGLDPLDAFGTGLALLGDVDGDGFPELAVGAPRDDDLTLDHGATWILFLNGCFLLDFETDDALDPLLANGQDISTPPEFGHRVALASSGPNAGAALFDSTPGGPNDPSQDSDLLVGSGRILILQTDANPTQSVPGYFNRPNDDEDGGTLAFTFTRPVMPRRVDLVDIDQGADEASTLVLTDGVGRLRIFSIPPGWTGDLLVDGVGARTLDLSDLAPQPGFASSVTAVEDAGFDERHVVALDLHLGSSGGLDNLLWCPPPPKKALGAPRRVPLSGPRLPANAR